MDQRVFSVWTLNGGKVTNLTIFSERAEAEEFARGAA